MREALTDKDDNRFDIKSINTSSLILFSGALSKCGRFLRNSYQRNFLLFYKVFHQDAFDLKHENSVFIKREKKLLESVQGRILFNTLQAFEEIFDHPSGFWSVTHKIFLKWKERVVYPENSRCLMLKDFFWKKNCMY